MDPNPTKYAPRFTDWQLMLKRIREGRCVPFLGAGASLGFGEGPGLPTAWQLAESLANACKFPGPDPYDFFRVTQFYRMVYDEHALRKAVRDRLLVPGAQPSVVHRTLAQLPIPYVLTTNFDRLMERAFEDVGKSPRVGIYERRGSTTVVPNATPQEPYVYKLHGSLDQLATMVITEDDIVDFLACMMLGEPPVPAAIKTLFEEYSVLFIGYGLKDLNVRVMLRALRGRRSVPPDVAYFAIQRSPENPALAREWEETVMFWNKRESLQCFDLDAAEFVTELKRRYDAGEGEI